MQLGFGTNLGNHAGSEECKLLNLGLKAKRWQNCHIASCGELTFVNFFPWITLAKYLTELPLQGFLESSR
jgi:hypothetical protein